MWKHDALIAKTRVMSVIAELTLRKKTRRGRKSLSPSVRDNCRLCVKFGSQGDQIGTENLQFQPSRQTGSFTVILAKLYMWKCWIATEFVVPEERKSEPFISCIRSCQAPCLVLKTRGVKVKRDSSARFKRCLQARRRGGGGGVGGRDGVVLP